MKDGFLPARLGASMSSCIPDMSVAPLYHTTTTCIPDHPTLTSTFITSSRSTAASSLNCIFVRFVNCRRFSFARKTDFRPPFSTYAFQPPPTHAEPSCSRHHAKQRHELLAFGTKPPAHRDRPASSGTQAPYISDQPARLLQAFITASQQVLACSCGLDLLC
jgi:hypothetical protein